MQTKFKRLAGAMVLAMGGLAAQSASAAILIDTTLTPSGMIAPLTLDNGDWAASLFSTGNGGVCAGGCTLDTITLRIGSADLGGTLYPKSKLELSVFSNVGNALGAFITTLSNPASNLTYHDAPYDAADIPGIQTYAFMSAPVALADNTSYWVKLTGLNDDPMLNWDRVYGGESLQPFGLNHMYSSVQGLAMKVEVTPGVSAVPIPGAVWLMGSALVGFVGWGRRLQV